jgi:hypothetical protein
MFCSECGGGWLRTGSGGLFGVFNGLGWKSLSLIGCAMGSCSSLLSRSGLYLGRSFSVIAVMSCSFDADVEKKKLCSTRIVRRRGAERMLRSKLRAR